MEYLTANSENDFMFFQRCFARIHLDRLERNCIAYKELVGDSELCCVVKADAYGHCVEAVAPFLQNKLGIKWFAVSNISEGIELRRIGINENILILGPVSPKGASLLNEYNLITCIPGVEYARRLNDMGISVKGHIKLDTGMSRIGIVCEKEEEAVAEIEQIYSLKNLDICGIFTHLCVADSIHEEAVEFTKLQISRFKRVCKMCEEKGMKPKCKHFLNSGGGILPLCKSYNAAGICSGGGILPLCKSYNAAGICSGGGILPLCKSYNAAGICSGEEISGCEALKKACEGSDLVRLGIMQYGLMPDNMLPLPIKIEPVMELMAEITQIKTIKKGDTVSYGRTFAAEHEMKLATVSCGYADGVSRLLSGKGEVIVRGKRAKILGKICMDQMMIDVDRIECEVGDLVTVYGSEITADMQAEKIGTIGYELVCAVSKRVPRVIVYNGEVQRIYL